MKKTLALVLTAVLSLGVFTGCGQAPKEDTKVEDNKGEENKGEENKEEEKITFKNGDIELPTKFDNFAVLDYTLIDQFVSLDVAPKYGATGAVPTAESKPSNVSYYNDGWVRAFEGFDLETITRIDLKSETYLEELVDYAPDFIVITERHEKFLDKLTAIAPTYVFPSTFDVPEGSSVWKEQLKFVGQFVNKADLADDKIAEYDALVEESRKKVADEIEGKTALVVQLNEKGFKIRMPETQASVYADLGFAVPEGLDNSFASGGVTNEEGSFPVEQIVQFNPDYIFIQTQSHENYESLVGTPIWENIQAVKDGRLYEINQSTWNHLNGYLANTLRLNDLVYFITEDKQTSSYTPLD